MTAIAALRTRYLALGDAFVERMLKLQPKV